MTDRDWFTVFEAMFAILVWEGLKWLIKKLDRR